jgi:hypothetical protein
VEIVRGGTRERFWERKRAMGMTSKTHSFVTVRRLFDIFISEQNHTCSY